MSAKESLKPKTAARLPRFVHNDLTGDCWGHVLFLTHIFANGFVMGFWSHSPWGNVHDQEQGWAVLNTEGKVVDSCETRTGGQPAGNDFRAWQRQVIEDYGKRSRLADEITGEMCWSRERDC